MKRFYNINSNVPSDCRPWLDGRELLCVSHNGVSLYYDIPNNPERSSRISSVIETEEGFVVWATNSSNGEINALSVSKPLTPETTLAWVAEEDLFRYLAPVEWWDRSDEGQRTASLTQAYLLGMPDVVRKEFWKWAKSAHADRYPNQKEVLEWISIHY